MAARVKDRIISALLMLSLLAVVVPVLFVVYFLLKEGAPAITWSFLTQDPRNFMTAGGIRPAILGTIYLVILTILLAVPIGVLAAVYLTEYAKPNFVTRAIRLAIVNLAGVPSVVYGLFGLGLFVYALNFDISLLAGACTLAVLVLPLIITASEEALLTVPASFREASLALGASKWETIWRVVLPSSLPGILTGIILALGRAAGETAPIMFTCAVFYYPLFDLKPHLDSPLMALPYHLYIIATQVTGDPAVLKPIQWGTALVLLVLVLGMNLVAIILRSHLRRSRRW
jgi:phosphate transport system permease protein